MSAREKKLEMNWPEASLGAFQRLLQTGYFLPLGFMIFFLALVWLITRDMQSADVKALVIDLAGKVPTWMGWAAFVGATGLYVLTLKWTRTTLDKENQRQRELIDRLLDSPPKTKPFALKNDQ